MKRTILSIIMITSLVSLIAQVRLEGYMESQFGATKNANNFNWNMWDPNINIETRFFASPAANTEAYMKLYAEKYDKFNTLLQNTEVVLTEAHIKYRTEYKNRGIGAALFTRDQSFYWTDGSMLGLLNTGSVNDGGNGQGGRLDLWYPGNGSLTYVFSDYSGGQNDDIHLLRLRQSIIRDKLFMGGFYQRKNYGTSTSRLNYNEIYASDIRWTIAKKYYLAAEFACSAVPSEAGVTAEAVHYQEAFSQDLRFSNFASIKDIANDARNLLKSNVASQIEFRGFRISHQKWGSWFINPGAYTYGKDYRNYMGTNTSDKLGCYINTYYIVPQRAITLTMNYNYSSNQGKNLVHETEMIMDKNSGVYSEAYIEFVNGFKGKFSYNMKDDWWKGTHYDHNDLFSELSVENRIAKLLFQFKLKDIGVPQEKQIIGMETGINLTTHWRLFARGMILDNRAEANHSIFGELQYIPGNNTEFYLQYGPSYWGAYGLVNDDGFTNNGTMSQEIKMIIKCWF
jgi:hypothetical protein